MRCSSGLVVMCILTKYFLNFSRPLQIMVAALRFQSSENDHGPFLFSMQTFLENLAARRTRDKQICAQALSVKKPTCRCEYASETGSLDEAERVASGPRCTGWSHPNLAAVFGKGNTNGTVLR